MTINLDRLRSVRLKLRRGLVKLTMCSAVGLDERYKKKCVELIPWGWWLQVIIDTPAQEADTGLPVGRTCRLRSLLPKLFLGLARSGL